ncbi:MAG: hypothetical protein P9E24_07905 [Candidatus Competibacter sp.]|nr:hypothetical protein [Candidatus Competibacter sp.]MDG4585224.1 hypothetical protein [Candidatus Competibacter sp.]
MRRLGLLLLICALGAYWAWSDRPIERSPGVLAPDPPAQRPLDAGAPVFQKDRYHLKALAEFSLEARVLGREDYRFDAGADLSPIDLALGWGPMSDSSVLGRIEIRQRNRFYYWRVDDFFIPRRDIETHSANMHLIPATGDIADQLKSIRPGHIVSLHGYLVEVRRDDGWQWRSSLSREDTGNGACELIWLETVAWR